MIHQWVKNTIITYICGFRGNSILRDNMQNNDNFDKAIEDTINTTIHDHEYKTSYYLYLDCPVEMEDDFFIFFCDFIGFRSIHHIHEKKELYEKSFHNSFIDKKKIHEKLTKWLKNTIYDILFTNNDNHIMDQLHEGHDFYDILHTYSDNIYKNERFIQYHEKYKTNKDHELSYSLFIIICDYFYLSCMDEAPVCIIDMFESNLSKIL